MKKILFVLICAGCLMMTGCSTDEVDSVKETVGETARVVKESVDTYNRHKDIEVHSEEEMREFALNCLEEKYGKTFVIDEGYCEYEHFNGHENMPMTLRARAYLEGDENVTCGLYVEEPNIFKDNYSAKCYLPQIKEKIFPEMEKYGIEGEIELEYPVSTGTVGDNLSADDIIYDGSAQIYFYQEVEEESDISAYIPLVRKWLDFLYNCDYDWYFTLTAEGNINYQYIGITKGDFGYTSTDEWSDERIIHHIETSISSSDWHLEND